MFGKLCFVLVSKFEMEMSKIIARMWSSSKVKIRDLFCTVYVSGLARSPMLGPSSMAAQMEQG